MAKEIERRKAEQLEICLTKNVQARKVTAGFEDIRLIHHSIPEISRQDVLLSTSFFGKELSAPLIVGAMTGGTERAAQINGSIAEAVETLNLGMGLGSQRAALEYPELEETYTIARKKAPQAFLIANIGGVQLAHGFGLREVKKVVEMIDADALAVHLNALQEAIQPNGQTCFKGVLAKIGEIAGELDKPLIVKETGCGISAEDAKALEKAGVKAIDVGGTGGTSFAAVEYYRSTNGKAVNEAFWDWGIPTVASLIEVTQTVKIPIIGCGGVRNGIDIAKCLALNASLASVCYPVLLASINGAEAVETLLSSFIDELRDAMFLLGAENLQALAKVPLMVTGTTWKWLNSRGFNTDKYMHRASS